jgi:hypothetical protein
MKAQPPSPAAQPPAPSGDEFESLVKRITDQVMHAMNGSANGKGDTSVVKGQTYASGVSGGI